MLLLAREVQAFYGDSHVLHGVDLEVREGEVVCLLGRNGVGKTTFLNSIMGLVDRRAGHMGFQGQSLMACSPYQIARLGISLVPEDRGIFAGLSVYENLLLGMINGRAWDAEALPEVYAYFPILEERRHQSAETLSGGEQQMLAIARGLVGRPKLMLIDEFSEGLQPSMVRRIAEIIEIIHKRGVSVLLVEQNSRLALSLASRFYIMEKGRVVHWGEVADLEGDEAALRRYLVI